ncbi:class I SAM-dependent RNA methyltransferase [Cyanobacterium sp. Dongsha4]|uniref:THUMP domain-containing class I SAM-dependent RNA methyltransferase n=1 Tax=Cyanobacterium sp. DS4 TaxID=2878255 RepID=UPI002E80098C|nr:class I SAM-dependent RNA methyltransferase [Cyanobacterium sp. Dongsha4]WVL02151.1 class I SAM-dependent RNA methyltransferase [Cyanobacterium sp. Dongsha4]
MTTSYFATTSRGLEEITAQELTTLGAKEVKTDFTGVHFQGDKELLYRVNLWGRTIFRVLKPIATIKSQTPQQLFRNVQKIDWSEFLQPQQTLAIRCTGKNDQLNHSHFTAIQIKNAIVEQQQKYHKVRSNIDTDSPDIVINAHIHHDECILSLDSTGESLHRRGYRPAVGLAPLKETLGAALLYIAEWDSSIPLYDPFCGSGTILIEGALMGLNIAPGLYRHQFCFENWQDYDHNLWQHLIDEARKSQKTDLPPIVGTDIDSSIIKQAQHNAKTCQIANHVEFFQRHLVDATPPAESGILICNPPYGKRLEDTEALFPLYKLLGDILKQRFKGWTAYILTGNKLLTKKVGLRTSRRIAINNGGIDCTLLKYELY